MPLPTRPQQYCDPASLIFYLSVILPLAFFDSKILDRTLAFSHFIPYLSLFHSRSRSLSLSFSNFTLPLFSNFIHALFVSPRNLTSKNIKKKNSHQIQKCSAFSLSKAQGDADVKRPTTWWTKFPFCRSSFLWQFCGSVSFLGVTRPILWTFNKAFGNASFYG